MRLATRLSAFFLGALFLVLTGFSIALYGLSRSYLIGQLDERLELALDTLEASVDIERGGLEWEPADRRMMLGVDQAPTSIRWAVRAGDGVLVDRSANVDLARFPSDWKPDAWPRDPSDGTSFGTMPAWRMAARRLVLDDLLKQWRGHPEDAPGYEARYPVLVLVVGLVPAPIEATLGHLGLALAGLSALIWVSAALAGRWLCVRALSPVRRMARSAAAMTAAELELRLPVPGTGDELDELGGAFNDLLERRQEAFVRLHESFDRQRQFAGDASHQLRTPLAALLGQTQIALRRDRTPDDYRRALSRVRDEGTRLKSIVESLLLLAQPTGTGPLPQPIELGGWLRDQVRQWSLQPRGGDLRCDIDEDAAPTVRANPLLLAQLLDNLIENAWKYSETGSPVTVELRCDDGHVVVGVSDQGCGLSADELTHIFEPFFRGESAKRDGIAGVGLGLAIAHRIALDMGGTLVVESAPSVGTRFLLRLPEVTYQQKVTSEELIRDT
jgi:signal transduction histidine kinase